MAPWSAVEVERDTSPEPAWPPRPVLADPFTADGTVLALPGRWRHDCGAHPHTVHTSGDRVLVLTDSLEYHAWGMLGPALLLDLATGTRIADLRGERGAALPGGRFVLGLSGYSTFHTWLHDRDGELLTTWPSTGHLVVEQGDVRVVESHGRSNVEAAVVRLRPGGVIDRGHRLRETQVAAPVLLPDGTLLLCDGGDLVAVDRELHGYRLATVLSGIAPDAHWRHTSTLHLVADTLTVTTTARDEHDPVSYRTTRVRYQLR